MKTKINPPLSITINSHIMALNNDIFAMVSMNDILATCHSHSNLVQAF